MGPQEELHRLLDGPKLANDVLKFSSHLIWANHAHLIALGRGGWLGGHSAEALLKLSSKMSPQDLRKYSNRSRRDLYFTFEGYFVRKLGPGTGGLIHLGRSRNDLNATLVRMYLRERLLEVEQGLCALVRVLLDIAELHRRHIMTGYTHLQPAQPITLGYYLEGFAQALMKSASDSVPVYETLNVCPLGAGAFSGSMIPIDHKLVSHLLGFSGPTAQHLEAIANQEHVLKFLRCLSDRALLLTRLAQDLYVWCTAEFGYVRLDPSISDSSSMMPQKQNPFLLEKIKGRAGSVIGADITAVLAMKNTPFTNCVDAKSDSLRYLDTAIEDTLLVQRLTSMVLEHATFDLRKMEVDTRSNYSTMTDVAESLVLSFGLDFRRAYKIAKGAAAFIQARKLKLEDVTFDEVRPYFNGRAGLSVDRLAPVFVRALNPTTGLHRKHSPGGPSPAQTRRRIVRLEAGLVRHCRWISSEVGRLNRVRAATMRIRR